MRYGCVPLIIQPGVAQPLDDVLPYDDFSLSLHSFEGLATLHSTLAAVDADQHERLRAGVRRWAHAFNWHDEHGQAYEYVRYSLCLRSGTEASTCDALCPHTLAKHRARTGNVPGERETTVDVRRSWGSYAPHVAQYGTGPVPGYG